MIIVIASRHDLIARTLVAHWMAYDAVLLTCEDLSVAGWRHYPGAPAASTARLGGREVRMGHIAGVLTRLPYISDAELTHIATDDRAYVAAEMMAFLVSWLSRLACPVLNRPTPLCLAGPHWRQAQWVYTAARLGLSVRPWRRQVVLGADTAPKLADASPVTVTMVGHQCFGPVATALRAQALSLANAARAGLLAVHFSGPDDGANFLGVDLVPDVSSPEVADAILDYLLQGGAC
jgi:hypothetical protein